MIFGAAAFVFADDGRLLVVKENYGRFRWSLPGGEIELGETPQDAVVREAREETGAQVAVDHLVGMYRFEHGVQAYAFRCDLVDGVPGLQPTDELSAVEWVRPDAIPEPRSNLLHHALADALADRRGVVRIGLGRVN